MLLKLEPFCILTVEKAPDGQGGQSAHYSDGETIEAAAVFGQTAQSAVTKQTALTAQKPDPAPQYGLYTRAAVLLPFHCVVKRLSDGRCFRILTDAADTAAPASPMLGLRYYGAEVWRMPHEQI